MRATDIHRRLRERPFRPFRICLSDGSVHEVRHPEMAWVTKTVIYLAVPTSNGDALPDEAIWFDPIHISRVEPLSVAPPEPKSN